jgi:hypothetical protein
MHQTIEYLHFNIKLRNSVYTELEPIGNSIANQKRDNMNNLDRQGLRTI